MTSVVDGEVFTPWTFNVYCHDREWKEIEVLRRTNVTINVVTALLQSWKAVKATPEEPRVPWQVAVKKVACITVEVNDG